MHIASRNISRTGKEGEKIPAHFPERGEVFLDSSDLHRKRIEEILLLNTRYRSKFNLNGFLNRLLDKNSVKKKKEKSCNILNLNGQERENQ